jgi:glycosylphosphatidylinositol transamidase
MGITHTEIHSFNVSGRNMQTVHSILRANKAAGTESIVLATKFSSRESSEASLSSLGLLLGMMNHLKDQKWLAKDIILICTDAEFGDAGITEWLKAYHFNTQKEAFARGGNIQAAIIVEGQIKDTFGQLAILPEGANGRLANLDLLNTVYRIGRRDGLAPASFSISPNPIAIPKWIPPNVHSILNFMINQAKGTPTGDHGLFGMYHIDAVTLKPIYNNQSPYPVRDLSMGRIVEGSLRSLNNLIEHLHQSFYYYLLPSPERYISIGEYMISLALILFPFFRTAAFERIDDQIFGRIFERCCLCDNDLYLWCFCVHHSFCIGIFIR